jgi:hypothetical protein
MNIHIEPKFIPLYAFCAMLIGFIVWEAIKLIAFVINFDRHKSDKKKSHNEKGR